MKKRTLILMLFLCLLNGITLLQAQDFTICTGTSNGVGVSTLRKVQLPNCSSQLQVSLTQIYNDITFHPSGKLYGITSNGSLFLLDTITGAGTQVGAVGNPRIGVTENSLTCNAEGIIYATGNDGKLYSFNSNTLATTYLGTIQVNGTVVQAGGDLTFYKGDLYVASTSSLVKINLVNPANSTNFMNFNVPYEIYGIVSFVDCGQVSTYATTGDVRGIVFKIDWINRVLVNICQTNQIIYGGASRYEFRASNVLLDTTRIVNYTCDKTQAIVLPTRTLRNQLGCDSLVFERTDYVKPDTLINASITCNRLLARADTVRLRNIRGCDSLIITQVKFGVDSVNLVRQICSGDSVAFFNQWYKQSGNYFKNFTKASGCDSVIALKLTVFNNVQTVKDSFVCQTNQVKRDTVFLKNYIGCDSFSIRNQLIAPRINEKFALSKQICKGDYVLVGQNRFYTEGVFPVILKNAFGCDSTVNLTLKYLRSDSIVYINETCNPTKLKDSFKVFKNQFGCDSSIIFRPKLITNTNTISNLPTDIKLNIGDSVLLSPLLNFTPNFIQWTPPNLVSCANCPSVFSRVRQNSLIQFTARDAKDCAVTQEVRFLVDLNRRVYIPNSFSPNGDKVNDVFTLYGNSDLQMIVSLRIFNRWGEMVYSGDNLSPNTEGWNGQLNGTILSPDVFVYYAQLQFKDGETLQYQGNITLVK